MASGPLLEGGVDGSREKRRWVESKVYTRKIHGKGPKPNPNQNPQSSLQAQPLSSSQTLVTTTDELNSSLHQPQLPPSENLRSLVPYHQSSVASVEDACSLNHKPCANHDLSDGQNRSITINFASKTRHEVRELRKKLTTELELVRSLGRKLEARQLQISLNYGQKGASATGHIISQLSTNNVGASFPTRKEQAISASSLAIVAAPPLRHQLSVLVPVGAGQDNAFGDAIEKEKRTPKANLLYKNTDFLLGKEKLPTQEYNKKSKVNANKNGLQSAQNKFYEQSFKKCRVLLSKLMKHNHAWVFNSPVDADALGLTDYHKIIKHPMDLGTIESRLAENWYKTPREFSEDVRLTFHNAMTYNPEGQDVYLVAEQLLQMFEERWPIIEAELAYLHSSPPLKRPPPLDTRKSLERLDLTVNHSAVDSKTKAFDQITPTGRTPTMKKPKAKDPNKRDMTYDEKQRLSDNLQKLPFEKLELVVQIIRKRNSSLNQHDDEIEVDIDSVDTETLWELDRFLTNYKKSLSISKRKEALAILARAETEKHTEQGDQRMVSDAAPPGPVKGNKTVPVAKALVSPPVGGARIGETGSRPSSSSSDSRSTSTDSDSESSSGYGSDPEQCPAA